MIFRGWQKTSLIEYPGKVATVLFTGGCNFRCPFCYNSDLVLRPEKLPKIEEKEVLGLLEKRRKLYQAVMVTGGEPTMESGLEGFLLKVKDIGLLAGIETNGTNPDVLERLLGKGLLDYIAMDIKAPLTWKAYSRATGTKDRKLLENVRESVRIVMSSGKDYEFRTTIVPSLHNEEDIMEMARQLKGAKRYVLQQFTPKDMMIDTKISGTEKYPDSFIRGMRERIKGNFGECEARNLS